MPSPNDVHPSESFLDSLSGGQGNPNNPDAEKKSEPPKRLPARLPKQFKDHAVVDIEPIEKFTFEYRPPTGQEWDAHIFNLRRCVTAAETEKEYARLFTSHITMLYFPVEGGDNEQVSVADALPILRGEAFGKMYDILCSAQSQLAARLKN